MISIYEYIINERTDIEKYHNINYYWNIVKNDLANEIFNKFKNGYPVTRIAANNLKVDNNYIQIYLFQDNIFNNNSFATYARDVNNNTFKLYLFDTEHKIPNTLKTYGDNYIDNDSERNRIIKAMLEHTLNSKFKESFAHEFTHFLDDIKTNGEIFNKYKSVKNFKLDQEQDYKELAKEYFEYISHNSETNAFFIQKVVTVIDNIYQWVDVYKRDIDEPNDDFKFTFDELRKKLDYYLIDFKTFRKKTLTGSIKALYQDEKIKKRLLSRLYDLYIKIRTDLKEYF